MAERKKGPRYYSTTKSARQSMGEIIALLTEYGADAVNIQNRGGDPYAVAFLLRGVPYQLVPATDGVDRRLASAKVKADPAAVAWAQARALLELQLESIENGIATPETVLGGYALTSEGRTVGEMIAERKGELMKGERLLLTAGGRS